MRTVMQIKRGPRKSIPSTDNYPGQLFFATDTRELFATGTDFNVHKLRDVLVSPREPAVKVENQLWYDTVSNQLKIYHHTQWSAEVDGRIGDLNNLLTNDKSNIVSAINEVYQSCVGDNPFEGFLGKTVHVSFSSGAFNKKAVGAFLARTTSSSIILTPPAAATSFQVYTFIPGVAPLPSNNNPLLESSVSQMLIPLGQLTSIEIASERVSSSLTANPADGFAPLNVTFHCLVNRRDLIKEYLWDFGDGSSLMVTATNNCQHTYLKPGTFIAKCRVLDKYNYLTTSQPISIIVRQHCVAQKVITQVIDPWKTCQIRKAES